jgi:hypothetical protein
MNSIGAAWETFNPTITQGATPTKTGGAKYARIQKTVHYQGLLQFTSAGTAANIVACNLPLTATAVLGTFMANGSALFYDGSVNRTYTLIATLTGANNMQFWYDNCSNFFGAQPAITIANTDWLAFNVTYEAA